MKNQICLLSLILSATVSGELREPLRPGEVVYETDFSLSGERLKWSENASALWLTEGEDSPVLKVQVPPGPDPAGGMVQRSLNLSRYRGCLLLFECRAKAEEVSQPEAMYLGMKFMLHYQSQSEGPLWKNENNVHGSFDWRKLSFTQRIAADATDAEITVGLQGSSGTAWFDSIRITVLRGPLPERPDPPENPPPAFKGHDLPRLRGVMSPNDFRDEDLRILGEEWNANLIRWQITRNWGRSGTDRDLADYDRWIDTELEELDKALEACRRYGIKVVVDLHTPPGGRYENQELAIFHEIKYQDHFVEIWEKIAKRYQGNPAVWGYDLINEPGQNIPPAEDVADFLAAQVRAAEAVREIDATVPVFIEGPDWDSPAGFRILEPVRLENIIYQVHMYVPHAFTHQGVNKKWIPAPYPGEIENQFWDKQRLREELQPVRDFQLAYNVHIYVGEFSAVRWAPGAENYLRDCIELFEEYGWDWSYHAYREWQGWSVEHREDPEDLQPTDAPTARKQLLLRWFDKNRKPEMPIMTDVKNRP